VLHLTLVAEHVAAFEAWLTWTWPAATVLREWPVLASQTGGVVPTDAIDVLIRQGDEAWVIEHKPDRSTDTAAAAARYLSQFEASAEAFRGQGISVHGLGLDWNRLGCSTFVTGGIP
jgi:hypothetical protein